MNRLLFLAPDHKLPYFYFTAELKHCFFNYLHHFKTSLVRDSPVHSLSIEGTKGFHDLLNKFCLCKGENVIRFDHVFLLFYHFLIDFVVMSGKPWSQMISVGFKQIENFTEITKKQITIHRTRGGSRGGKGGMCPPPIDPRRPLKGDGAPLKNRFTLGLWGPKFSAPTPPRMRKSAPPNRIWRPPG